MRKQQSTKKQQKTVLKKKLTAAQQQLATVQGQLAAAKRSEEAIATELTSIEGQLTSTRQKLTEVKARLNRTRTEQQKVTVLLAKSQGTLAQAQRSLAQRMAANYRQGPVRYASVLLGAHTMGELVSRAELVRSIVKYESTLIAQIKAGREQVIKWKGLVDQKAGEIRKQELALGGQQDQEAQLVQKRRLVLLEAQAKRTQIEAEYAQLAADSNEILQRLQALEGTPLPGNFSGKLIQPVVGRVVSSFGMRFHPILKINRLHAGVDFGAGTGTPIVAAAAGLVAYSGTMRGYGNVVVIDHGDGISTLYAHCSVLLVIQGESVAQGKLIAQVGATGLATGPHLHFEVRRNGSPINPIGGGL
nr:peptidoglycan DD-metalloendopeptidase family protein [Armatimonas sp.]